MADSKPPASFQHDNTTLIDASCLWFAQNCKWSTWNAHFLEKENRSNLQRRGDKLPQFFHPATWSGICSLPTVHLFNALRVSGFSFFFFAASNYSALLQSFCISSQRLHHLNDEERESCACRLGSCILQSQPAWDWGSHNDQSSWSFTDWLLKQSHCLCTSPQKEGTYSGYLGKANVVIDTVAAQEASQSTAWRILCPNPV